MTAIISGFLGVIFFGIIVAILPVVPVPVSILAIFNTFGDMLAVANVVFPIDVLISVFGWVITVELLVLFTNVASVIYSLIAKK